MTDWNRHGYTPFSHDMDRCFWSPFPYENDEQGNVIVCGKEEDHGVHYKARVEPHLGCSLAAHEALGWCGRCPGVDIAIECTAWQARHVGTPWTYEYAKEIGVHR